MKNLKKTSVALFVGMMFMLVGVLTLIGAPQEKKTYVADGQQAIQGFSGPGIGTQADPFRIGDLTTLRQRLTTHAHIAGTHFELTNNIDLFEGGANWIPFASFARDSVFNGNGFTLDRLTQSGAGGRGMFGNFHGTMKNVNFTNVNLNGTGHAGVIAPQITGSIPGVHILIENVNIISGSIGVTQRPSQVGGFIGSMEATASGTAANRASFTIRNSSNTMTIMHGNSWMGGLLGLSWSTHIDINITDSFVDTEMRGSTIMGGIMAGTAGTGTPAGSRNVTIENVFVRGIIAGGTHTGGIMGYNDAPDHIMIRNSFVSAAVTGSSTPRGGIYGGAWSTSGVNVRIQNSFFNSDFFNAQITAATAIVGSGVAAVNFATSGTRTTIQMNTQAFVDLLNAGGTAWVLDPVSGRPELRAHTNRIFLSFCANGGVFTNGEVRIIGDWEADHIFTGAEIADLEPTRIGFTFAGWNTTADGTGQPFDITEVTASTVNRSIFAQWTHIPFTVVDFDQDNLGQSMHFHPGENTIGTMSTITINQPAGFARAYLASATVNDHFAGWLVLRNDWTGNKDDMENWVNLGIGSLYTGGNAMPLEHRLQFYRDGSFLIDENFISNFGYIPNSGPATITFRALFTDQSPMTVTFDAQDAASRNFGSIRIDGISRPVNTSTQFAHNQTTAFLLEVIPNSFRTVQSITVGGIAISSGDISYSNGVYSTSIVPTAGMNVVVYFDRQMFTLVVDANHAGAVTGGGIVGATTHSVGLGSSVTGTEIQSVEGFRLTSPSAQNIRIWNVLTQRYVYYNALDGQLATALANLDENFFASYVDNGQIRVVAVFVRQFAVNITNDDPDLGNLVLLIDGSVAPTGVTNFDEGTEITILIQPNAGAQVDTISGNVDPSEINSARTEIRFALDGVRNISVGFVVRQFTLTVQAVDMDGRVIDSSEITTSHTPGPLSLPLTNFNIGFNIEIPGLYAFRGWYVLIGNNPPLSIASYAPTPASNIDFNETFRSQFADGFNLRIIARFEMVHSVTFEVIQPAGVTGNTFTAEIMTFDGTDWVVDTSATIVSGVATVPAGTRLLITAVPNANFELLNNNIGGLNHGETVSNLSVMIVVDGLRLITFNFVPRQFQITTTMTLRGSGTMQTGTMMVSYGDVIMLTFNPGSGFELNTWRINDQAISAFGNDIRIDGNTVRIRITANTITFLQDHNFTFNNQIETRMNSTFMFGMLAAAIAIPLIVLIITMMMLSNSRKRKQYAELQARRQQGAVMMGQSEALKKLRQDMNK